MCFFLTIDYYFNNRLLWNIAMGGMLYNLGRDEVLRKCVMPHEIHSIIKSCHDKACGEHLNGLSMG